MDQHCIRHVFSARRMALSGLVGLAVLALPAQAAQPLQRSAAVRDGPSEAVEQWLQAVNSGDAAAIERLNDDATVAYTPTDNALHGRAAIVGGYRDMFSKYRAHATISDAHWLRTGEVLVSWGLFTLELQPREGGDMVRLQGRFSDVARRTAEGWRYVVDHASLLPKAP